MSNCILSHSLSNYYFQQIIPQEIVSVRQIWRKKETEAALSEGKCEEVLRQKPLHWEADRQTTRLHNIISESYRRYLSSLLAFILVDLAPACSG